jgi:hypothetical protein
MEQTTDVQMMMDGGAPVRMNLKPERVQQLLLALPGWKLRRDGLGIETFRRFTSARAASAFASLACRLATCQRQPVMVAVLGGDVVVRLQGCPVRGCTGGITEPVFNLAGLIGA